MVIYKYQIWDTAGQEKVSGVHCQQLTTCSLCDEDCTHCKHLEPSVIGNVLIWHQALHGIFHPLGKTSWVKLGKRVSFTYE